MDGSGTGGGPWGTDRESSSRPERFTVNFRPAPPTAGSLAARSRPGYFEVARQTSVRYRIVTMPSASR